VACEKGADFIGYLREQVPEIGNFIRQVEIEHHEEAGLAIDHGNGNSHVPPRYSWGNPNRDDRFFSHRREDIGNNKPDHKEKKGVWERDVQHDYLDRHNKKWNGEGDCVTG